MSQFNPAAFVVEVSLPNGGTHSATGEIIAEDINFLRDVCHQRSVAAGWWHDPISKKELLDTAAAPYVLGTKVALIQSEASEALEGIRKGACDAHLPHRPAAEVELADLVIRTMDLAGALGLDIGGALIEKMDYNARRDDHKADNRVKMGGKVF